jgi:hypothetical protein
MARQISSDVSARFDVRVLQDPASLLST